MIPLHLIISGFLSYREPVELDFTEFDLACIAGANGAGKSSLLDAITWVLFGQARKRDDSIINAFSDRAEVSLTFTYEGNIYRVIRSKPREKTTTLEFQILSRIQEAAGEESLETKWKPLTERALRDTEARIEQLLRLDYETFVNASFFLQGKADQFTQQRPGDRKRILGSILGLEIWEEYRQQVIGLRKGLENEVLSLEARTQEILAELAEEKPRKEKLEGLKADLERLKEERSTQASLVESLRKMAANLREQERVLGIMERQKDSTFEQLRELQDRFELRRQEQTSLAEVLARETEIISAYQQWQSLKKQLEEWEEVAGRFREQERYRQEPLAEIQTMRGRLTQEKLQFETRARQIDAFQLEINDLHDKIGVIKAEISTVDGQLSQREQMDLSRQDLQQRQANARAENAQLKPEMDELKQRIDQLNETEGAACPLCGQALGQAERLQLIDDLAIQGKEMGDQYRANLILIPQLETKLRQVKQDLADLTRVENELRKYSQALAQNETRLHMLKAQVEEWETVGLPRLKEIALSLAEETFAPQAFARLAEIDAQLKTIGYDAAQHDQVRRKEAQERASEAEFHALERAKATLIPVERGISELQASIERQQKETDRLAQEFQGAKEALVKAQAQMPDLPSTEQLLLQLQSQENHLHMEVGAAQQKVSVLADLKARRKQLEAKRQAHAQLIAQYKQLERAFGKDGIPALLIEQALPQIESKANEVLDRLSNGSMTVNFVTQSPFKDKRREDLKETLDIQIQDEAGRRDYEMFSGGEAFRVNFAIRLALSEILAQRAGARLQTLVIDEGFGSQDAEGRQRLIEAINLIRPDFAKILVITHIDELKDQFPFKVDVRKTEHGSQVQVVPQ